MGRAFMHENEINKIILDAAIEEHRTLLRLTGLKLGIVINFGEKRVVDGYHRVVNKL